MANDLKNSESVFADATDLYGTKLNPVPTPKRNIGIDTDGEFYDALINGVKSSMMDISKLESFTQVSQNRELLYEVIDTMCEDTTIASALEIYTEDSTELSENGRIVWCQSDDEDVLKYITYLLDVLNVDKNIFKWAYCLCKYGDVYLRMYRNSDIEDGLFNSDDVSDKKKYLKEELDKIHENRENSKLDESVIVHANSKDDRYAQYVEMVSNPAEMFELTKFGKTYAYIKAPVRSGLQQKQSSIDVPSWRYRFNRSDVTLYDATAFVHASLEDDFQRFPESVEIFLNNDMNSSNDTNKLSYTVRHGQSILYSVYKLWRTLTLLENSLLLNRLTKSSVLRVINVEVGDMPQENVGKHMMGIKALFERKVSLDTGNIMSEYTNPGPMENCIYVPMHNGIGSITPQQIGGDVDVKGLTDIDYFKNKLFGGLKIPKQYMGDTEDGAGFNGGASLSLISARYAKTIKRVQNTLIQLVTDLINLLLLDKGLVSYVNKFTIKMQPPTTQEEIDRRDNLSSKVGITQDVMNLLSDVEDPSQKLRILKILLAEIIDNPEVINVIQEEIDKMEGEGALAEEGNNEPDDRDIDVNVRMPRSGGHAGDVEIPIPTDDSSDEMPPAPAEEETIAPLPSPADLGIDMTDTANL